MSDARVTLTEFERIFIDREMMHTVLRDGVKTVNATARKMLRTGGRTGRRRWTKHGGAYTASSPSEVPARVTGNLAKSIRIDRGPAGRRSLAVAGKVTAPHTHLLFLGTKHVAARADVMALALEQHDAEIQRNIGAALGRALQAE